MKKAGTIFVFTLILLGVSPGFAQKFSVGVEDMAYYPYSLTLDGQFKDSYAKAILDAFAQKKGYEFQYVPLPINRLYTSLVRDKIDFKYPDNPNWQMDKKRNKNVLYSDNVISYVDGTMVRSQDRGRSLGDLKAIGTILGFTPRAYDQLIQENGLEVRLNQSPEALIQQLLSGRIDAAFINVRVAEQILTKMKKESAVVFDKSLPYQVHATSLSTRRYPGVLNEFNDFLRGSKKQINELRKKYDVEVEL